MNFFQGLSSLGLKPFLDAFVCVLFCCSTIVNKNFSFNHNEYANDIRRISNAIEVFGDGVAVFGAYKSAMSLLGIESESFEKTIKNLQKEGLFENVSSFDLNFNGKGINIKLNEGTYEWGANFGHNIDDDIEDNEDIDYYTARPDKLFKSEEAAIRACEKYCDANPSDYCEVLHYHADSGWQVSEEYDRFYD